MPDNNEIGRTGVSQAWIDQYFPGYDVNGGVTTVTGGGVDPVTGRKRPTITHTGSTPETDPWAYSANVDPSGRVYNNPDGSPIIEYTGKGWNAGRQVTPEQMKADYAKYNYFQNGGKGLDPRLMKGMTTNDPRGNSFRNQYGTYTRQHAFNDPARKAAGLDPWTEVTSRFQGVGMDGKPINHTNPFGVWGNRGPGFQGGQTQPPSSYLSLALRNQGGSSQPAGGTPPPANSQQSASQPQAGGGAPRYLGVPSGHDSFGKGSGANQTASVPQWWQQMMANKPGQA